MKLNNKRLLANAVGALLATAATAATAVDSGDVLTIHGYGNQNYFQASDNTYLGADSTGTWASNTLSLVFTVKVDDKTKIWAQLHSSVEPTRLDWMFIDYQLTRNLTGRAGQIKLPIGLYNEIRDIEFLHLSTLDPSIYQEASEIAHESFRGVSAIYTVNNLSLDVYTGQAFEPEPVPGERFGQLLGGRLTYKTPVDGLRFMASAYSSGMEVAGLQDDKKTWVLSADYTSNNWDLKAEYAQSKVFGEETRTWYTQAGYTFAERWTPFVRYDYITTDQNEKSDPAHYQKTASFGVSYKINSGIGVRVENHRNRGYALPVATGEATAGAGTLGWNIVAASVYFIF